MVRFLIRRLLWAVFLFIAVTLVTYVIFFLAPANPERLVCGGERATTACLEQAREDLAIDKPIYVQYGKFLERLVIDRSLGESYITNRPGQRHHQERRPRHGGTRLRRRDPVDDDRAVRRDPVGAPTTILDRPSGDDLRARSASRRTPSGSA